MATSSQQQPTPQFCEKCGYTLRVIKVITHYDPHSGEPQREAKLGCSGNAKHPYLSAADLRKKGYQVPPTLK